jgi:hypothetical protein
MQRMMSGKKWQTDDTYLKIGQFQCCLGYVSGLLHVIARLSYPKECAVKHQVVV